ncbi:filamentous haemagglutinin family protein [Variovorax sp.]|jgi:filamentous hemagglutinin|uniref:filamentous haemagglutinin family protein n=5 Tax=Variovorax sp. TaxID=1871043 RepID=UPI0025D450AE|nr:filamentous haemagglutinin family protein [Variovorax sp.]
MNTRARIGRPRQSLEPGREHFSLAPIARAIALVLVAGGVVGPAQAQRAFSGAWFNAKGTAQSTAAATGYLPNGQPASSLTNPQALQQRNNAQWQRSLNNLNLAAQSIAAQQAAQAAARQAAQNDDSVPDGLVDGGLKVDSQSLSAGWLNAKAPQQSLAEGRTQVRIEQTAEKAILNWESFNVGRNTTVQFDQRAGTLPDGSNGWVALNRVNDPSGRPSRIAGQIKADGSVYIVNRNGIVFTGSSQVDTRSLVASALRLTDRQFMAGINTNELLKDPYGSPTNTPAPQFGEFPEVAPYTIDTTVENSAPWFTPSHVPGSVSVQAGARLTAQKGGKLMLFAPKVANAGTLSAPDGQVVMAAGENVWLSSVPSNAGPDTVPYYLSPARGFEVAASAVPAIAFGYYGAMYGIGQLSPSDSQQRWVKGVRDTVMPAMVARAAEVGYQVDNSGQIDAPRGDITLTGRTIAQNGILQASSALNNREGSIRLQGWSQGLLSREGEFAVPMFWDAGTVTFGRGSVTAVMPDLTDKTELELGALATRYRPGRIVVGGERIDVQRDARLVAPAGEIRLLATAQPSGVVPDKPANNDASLRDGSRIYIDDGAWLSVAGLQDIPLSMASNLVTADLRINELRDSPLYRDSWLRGQKVVVDRRVRGVFGNGPMAGVLWIGENDPGAWVGTPLADVSTWVNLSKTTVGELATLGGHINLKAGGSVITRAGSMLDIAGGSVKYGDGWIDTTKLLSADGRVVDIGRATPDMQYVGIAGRFSDSHARWGVTDDWRSALIGRPRFEPGYTEGRDAGSIQVFAGEAYILEGGIWGGTVAGERATQPVTQSRGGRLVLGNADNPAFSFSPGQLILGNRPELLPADFTLESPVDSRFFTVDGEGRYTKTSWLSTDTLEAAGLGAMTFNVGKGFLLEKDAVLRLEPGAALNVGLATLDTNVPVAIEGTVRAPGGSVNLPSGQVKLGASARIDVSGSWVNTVADGPDRLQHAIKGGSIILGALQAETGAVLDVSGGGQVSGSATKRSVTTGNAGAIQLLTLGSADTLDRLDLRAFSAGSGGALSINANGYDVQLGGNNDGGDALLHLPADLYASRGFRSLTVDNAKGIVVPEGVAVSLRPQAIDLGGVDATRIASGANLAELGPLRALPLEQRLARAPASLLLAGNTVEVGTGARIEVDTGGSLQLGNDSGAIGVVPGSIVVRGTLEAPAGRIGLYSAGELRLADGASLLARGVPAIHRDGPVGRSGSVLDGGRVLLRGDVQLDAGSLIDVSGSAGEIDVPRQGFARDRGVATLALASDGGSIEIEGHAQVLGTLRARAGGAGARGGSLKLTSAGGAESPADQLKWIMLQFAGGEGVAKWADAIGVDYSSYFSTAAGPFVFTREMVELFEALPDAADFRVVNKVPAAGGGPALPDATAFFADGYLEEILNFGPGFDLRGVFTGAASAKPPSVLLASAVNEGGFDQFAIQTPKTVRLDGVHLQLGRSITIGGTLANAGRADASLRAPRIVLSTPSVTPGNAAAERAGSLNLDATLIDIDGGAAIRGFADTVLTARDLRIADNVEAPGAVLDVEGRLLMQAAQVYPATGAKATIRATDAIRIERNGEAETPLSAAGSLTLEAPRIAQNGVLRAPFGQIVLKAGESVTLGAGSITSVSGDGLVLPYGALRNNEFWTDPTRPQTEAAVDLNAPPEKRITLDAPSVELAAGSVVDVAGGGDLHAREFVPGTGGSHDLLAMPGVFAILPASRAAMAPGAAVGERIWLAGGQGLEAGWYAVLPASYAALPGAFAVMPGGGVASASATRTVAVADGSMVVSGYRGDGLTGAREVGYTAWRVLPGQALRGYSEYNEALASEFFSSDAFRLTQYRRTGTDIAIPRLPVDAGSLVLRATDSLKLDGRLDMKAAAGGRGGMLDIAAQKIAVVGAGQDGGALRAQGYLVIDAASLSNTGAASLLIGGVRTGDPLGMRVEVTASDIVVRNDGQSALSGPELILAASGQVTVESDSVLTARGGTASTGSLVIAPQAKAIYTDPDGWLDDNYDGVIDAKDALDDVLTAKARDWGALIRLSNAGDARVLREGVDLSEGGRALIQEGAVLQGGASLTIDATRGTTLASSAQVSGSGITLSGGRVGFGGGSEGLVFDQRALAQLANAERLRLRSYTSMDFHGDIDFGRAGLGNVTLDAATLAGYGNASVVLRAQGLTLENSVAAVADAAALPVGTGTLAIRADELVLGTGDKSVQGFGQLELAATRRILGEGSGSLDAGAADIRLATPLLTARAAATQALRTTGLLALAGGQGAATEADPADGQGARLTLAGGRVDLASQVLARGGSVNVTAASGDLRLREGAAIDVSGFEKRFFDVTQYGDAGSIALTAIGGSVRLDAGAALRLAGAPAGGAAGTLALTVTGNGAVVLDGLLDAHAASGQRAGSISYDSASLPDFAGLSARLNDAGFQASRSFRVRSGDVLLDGTTRAEDFLLVADQGHVTLAGMLDTRSAYGGRIRVVAGDGITMNANAALLAGATGPLGYGSVTLDAADGALDLRGGRIDVGGGQGGRVRLRAGQTAAHDDLRVTALNADIVGAQSAVLEGVARYDVADYDGLSVDSVKADAIAHARTFEGKAQAIAARLGASGIAVMPGIEIGSAGDLALQSDWNLAQDFATAREGSLTLRAGGNLLLNGSISDGFSDATTAGSLQTGRSWNLALVAGADRGSADALALVPLAAQAAGQGTITLGAADAGKLVRTGTGEIELRAGRDLVLADKVSAIYTAGRRDTTTYDDFTAPADAAYGIDGGSMRLVAQGSVHAKPTDQSFVEWLRRQGQGNWRTGLFSDWSDEWGTRFTGMQPSWWIDPGQFQGLGALGGGNLALEAGGDLDNVVAVLPTNARLRGALAPGQAATLEMRNGGLFDIKAGGTIRAGHYYVGRGAGSITAGEMAVGRTVTATDANGVHTWDIAPILALGDATLDVRTQGNLRLETVVDPLLLQAPLVFDPCCGPVDPGAYMSGHTNRTALRLVSLGGDLTLVDTTYAESRQIPYMPIFRDPDGSPYAESAIGQGGNRYPAATQVVAMSGSVIVQGPVYTMTAPMAVTPEFGYIAARAPGAPAPQADFQLLAAQDLVFRSEGTGSLVSVPRIVLSRAAPELIPSPLMPRGREEESGSGIGLDGVLQNTFGSSYSRQLGLNNPEKMPLDGDHSPSRIYALGGSILGATVATNEESWIRAGHDIRQVSYNLRNLHGSDVSIVSAGNDVIGSATDVVGSSPGIVIEGPGALLVSAGRDIFAPGARDGNTFPLTIQSVGNQSYAFNASEPRTQTFVKGLPERGASITLMAGLQGKEPDYAAFAQAYLDPARAASMPAYLTQTLDGRTLPLYLTDDVRLLDGGGKKFERRGLVSFVQEAVGETLAPLDAWARFQTLPAPARERFLREVYMQELRNAGRDQLLPGVDDLPLNGGYNRGYGAIATLFPGNGWKGDVQMADGSVRTLQGGGIEVLAPGGGLQVAALGQAPADGRGLVTLGDGDIHVFTARDVLLNRSRMLTFAGGDEIIWSTLGDIDAGRGAKTTRSFRQPVIETDADGITRALEKADITGSGIGTVEGFENVVPGDVDLVAPKGTVNAGDAGIRVSGNLNIAALHVLNAANIEVKGESKGLPVVTAVNVGALTNASAAASQAANAAQETVQRERAASRQALPSVFTVRVLGFGNEPAEGREPPPEARPGVVRYEPNHRVQVIGHGAELKPDLLARLTEEERRRLQQRD